MEERNDRPVLQVCHRGKEARPGFPGPFVMPFFSLLRDDRNCSTCSAESVPMIYKNPCEGLRLPKCRGPSSSPSNWNFRRLSHHLLRSLVMNHLLSPSMEIRFARNLLASLLSAMTLDIGVYSIIVEIRRDVRQWLRSRTSKRSLVTLICCRPWERSLGSASCSFFCPPIHKGSSSVTSVASWDPSSTLSHHLEKLKNEGLVKVRRDGTFLWYSADTAALQELVGFLYASAAPGTKPLSRKRLSPLLKKTMSAGAVTDGTDDDSCAKSQTGELGFFERYLSV